MVRGGPAVRLIEHILINSISPACNRPHGYLTVLVMVASSPPCVRGRACSAFSYTCVCVCVCGIVLECVRAWRQVERPIGTVPAGLRTARASVRQRRHRFGLHAPIIGRLIGWYSATDSALHRFRVPAPTDTAPLPKSRALSLRIYRD